MTEVLSTFAIAFLISFVGTIPPGALNLTIIQLGLKKKIDVAWRMALAAGLIEYPYGWAAVEFQHYLSESLEYSDDFHLVSGVVMVLLGVVNLWSSARPGRLTQKFESSGFRKGLLLSLLNPLAIPFWIAMTAYLRTNGWIDLSDQPEVHAYLMGISMGTIVLCILLAYLARKVVAHFDTNSFLQKTPGVLLILLGVYAFGKYIFG